MLRNLILLSLTTLFLIPSNAADRIYKLTIDISKRPRSGTTDEVFFRMCRGSVCGLFQRIKGGLLADIKESSHNYYVQKDLGDVDRITFVHRGGDNLCMDWIKIDEKKYDQDDGWFFAKPSCIRDEDGNGCDVIDVQLKNNKWSDQQHTPCTYSYAQLIQTYMPTEAPTGKTKSPTQSPTQKPSKMPSLSPSSSPTNKPSSVSPTEAPTSAPVVAPTNSPVEAPTNSPVESKAAPDQQPQQITNNAPQTENNNHYVNNNYHTHQGGDNKVLYIVIGVLSGIFVCLLALVLSYWFCWRPKKAKGEKVAVDDVTVEAVDAQSELPEGVLAAVAQEGTNGTRQQSTDPLVGGTAGGIGGGTAGGPDKYIELAPKSVVSAIEDESDGGDAINEDEEDEQHPNDEKPYAVLKQVTVDLDDYDTVVPP